MSYIRVTYTTKFCYFISLIFGLEIKAKRYPNIIAADIPPAAAVIPPVNIPKGPILSTCSITPVPKQ